MEGSGRGERKGEKGRGWEGGEATCGGVPNSERRVGKGREGRRPRMLSRPCNAAPRPPLTQFRGARVVFRAVGHGGPPRRQNPRPAVRRGPGQFGVLWGEGVGLAPPHHAFAQGRPKAHGATQALGRGLPQMTQEGSWGGGELGISLGVAGGTEVRPDLTCS